MLDSDGDATFSSRSRSCSVAIASSSLIESVSLRPITPMVLCSENESAVLECRCARLLKLELCVGGEMASGLGESMSMSIDELDALWLIIGELIECAVLAGEGRTRMVAGCSLGSLRKSHLRIDGSSALGWLPRADRM